MLPAFLGIGEGIGRLVDADHVPTLPDQLGHKEGDVSDAGCQVEDAHPRADPARVEVLAGHRLERGGLLLEPFKLLAMTPEDVVVLFGQRAPSWTWAATSGSYRYVVRPEGLEPPTFWSVARRVRPEILCSALSYGRLEGIRRG